MNSLILVFGFYFVAEMKKGVKKGRDNKNS